MLELVCHDFMWNVSSFDTSNVFKLSIQAAKKDLDNFKVRFLKVFIDYLEVKYLVN